MTPGPSSRIMRADKSPSCTTGTFELAWTRRSRINAEWPPLIVGTAIAGARQAHALLRAIDLILGEDETDFVAFGERRHDQHCDQRADDDRQYAVGGLHQTVVAAPRPRPNAPHVARLGCEFRHARKCRLPASRQGRARRGQAGSRSRPVRSRSGFRAPGGCRVRHADDGDSARPTRHIRAAHR